MARKGAPVFNTTYYHLNRKQCDEGHKGRIGRLTKLCAGCLEVHLAQGGWVFDMHERADTGSREGDS